MFILLFAKRSEVGANEKKKIQFLPRIAVQTAANFRVIETTPQEREKTLKELMLRTRIFLIRSNKARSQKTKKLLNQSKIASEDY